MTVESSLSAAQLMDSVAHWYDKGEGINDWFTSPLVRHFCPAHARAAMEIGCGVGRVAVELAKKVETVWGMDISEQMIQYARRRADSAGVEARFVQGDVLTFDFAEQRFDYIYGLYVLAYFDIPVFLERLRGLVRPGGRILLLDGRGDPGAGSFHLGEAMRRNIGAYVDYVQFMRRHSLPISPGRLVVNALHRRMFLASGDWKRVEGWHRANRERRPMERWKLVAEALDGVRLEQVTRGATCAVWDNGE